MDEVKPSCKNRIKTLRRIAANRCILGTLVATVCVSIAVLTILVSDQGVNLRESTPPVRALIYAYFETKTCAANLDFFLKYARIYESSHTVFVIIVNGARLSVQVPVLPNLYVLKRGNSGFDFYAYGLGVKYLQILRVNRTIAHYGFLNCGVTGPLLPAYLPRDFDWFAAFSSRLNSQVKVVGAYLSCLHKGDAGGQGPRVEGHSFFTDVRGLNVLIAGGVFAHHKSKVAAILHGEYAVSRKIFEAGYTVDTLLYRYQGVNWTDPVNWNCNQNRLVGRKGGYEGGDVDPFETIFFKKYWATLRDHPKVHYNETLRYMRWRGMWANGEGGYYEDLPLLVDVDPIVPVATPSAVHMKG